MVCATAGRAAGASDTTNDKIKTVVLGGWL
jgi:hypothetical protein